MDGHRCDRKSEETTYDVGCGELGLRPVANKLRPSQRGGASPGVANLTVRQLDNRFQSTACTSFL
jgi:hypothetical protein